jgi:hypothetical protein
MSVSDIDWFLIAFLEGVSFSGQEVGLTVFSGGLVISGTAVSEEVYFRRLGYERLAEASIEGRDQRRRDLEEVRKELEREDLPEDERRSLEVKRDERERKFIVMVDVSIFGASDAPLKAPTWRGRLSQISGWTIGTYEPTTNA